MSKSKAQRDKIVQEDLDPDTENETMEKKKWFGEMDQMVRLF